MIFFILLFSGVNKLLNDAIGLHYESSIDLQYMLYLTP